MRSSDTPVGIGDHGVLSNCHGAALVTRDGTIDWACLPRFDSPAVFALLLGDGAGHWSRRATDPGATATRRYLEATMVLDTTWRTGDAEVEVWDLLALGPSEQGDHIGRHAPATILRVAHGRSGTMAFRTELALRPEFGLVTPRHHPREGGPARPGRSELLRRHLARRPRRRHHAHGHQAEEGADLRPG